jgi:hypothetical protein
MKAFSVVALAAILIMAVTFANFAPAEAKKAEVDERLSPKSFGPKTTHKVNIEKTYEKSDSAKKPLVLKSEQLKTKLKLAETKKAMDFVKKTYGI